MIRFAAIFCLFPFMALADPVAIRSGEHETFSRLVLSIGEQTQWSFDPSENGIVLRLQGRSDGFNTASVFERIPRDRLLDVEQIAEDSLQLSLNCTCEHDAFLWKPGELVIDIFDPSLAPPTQPDPERETNTALPVVPVTPPAYPSDAPLLLPNMLVLAAPRQIASPTPPSLLQAQPASENLSITEAALAEGIARAATQGFLQPAITKPDATVPQELIVAEENTPRGLPDPPAVLGRPGVGISTAMDRDLALVAAAIGRSVDSQCLNGDLFQVDTWGDEQSFHAQVAALAEELAGEFGEEPIKAQETLARLYIHFGMGAEARATLAANAALSRDRLILGELAGIIDDYDGDYPLISAQVGCATPAAFWAFLIRPTDLEDDARNQLIQQFFTLPKPLRGQISSRLARRFVEVGDTDAASRLLNAATNSDAGATHESQSARAFVAEGLDDPVGARNVLEREANDNARTTPESLIRLIELDLEQGVPLSEADLLLASAMRQEHRGTPIEEQLADIEALGRISIGHYQDALMLVQGRQDDRAFAINDKVASDLTMRADAGTFLEFAFGDIPDGVTTDTENSFARRLIELGFPERATVLIQGPAEREAAAERRYLRAEAAIGTQDFVAAIDALLGMTDDRSRSLRARAFEGLGEHRAALASLSSNQADSTPTLQFRAAAWERLTVDQSDDVLSTFAQAVLEPPRVEPVETLADRRALLSQSQDSRRAVEDLLRRFDGTTLQN